MAIFITAFLCNLIIPIVMTVSGYFMYKHPPKEINGLIGYRTTMSKKNKDTWDFAHNLCGKLWLKIGGALFFVSAVSQIPFYNAGENDLSVLTLVIEAVQLTVIIVSIYIVENKLKKTFDKDGKRK